MGISKVQPMRPALDACIDAINDGFDPYVQPYIDAAQQATAQAQAATVLAQAATQAAQAATEVADTAAETATAAAESITDGYFPKVTVGAADGIKGGGPTVDGTFLHRVTGNGQASDGPATIEVIRGNTVRWNQLVNSDSLAHSNNITNFSIDASAHSATGTAPANTSNLWFGKYIGKGSELVGHKFYVKAKVVSDAACEVLVAPFGATVGSLIDGTQSQQNLTTNNEVTFGFIRPIIAVSEDNILVRATVLNNTLDAVVTIRNFQFFDLTDMFGSGNEPNTVTEFEQMFPAEYYPYSDTVLLSVNMDGIESADSDGNVLARRSIPTTDLRKAGMFYDELRKDERITRVGVIDLATLTWSWQSNWGSWYSQYISSIGHYGTQATISNVCHAVYPAVAFNDVNIASSGVEIGVATALSATPSDGSRIVVRTGSDSVTPTGILFYELITPTTAPIDPPLNMSYSAEQGGTETVLVPTGEMSAPVPMVICYGSTPDGILDRAAALIAAQDGPTATANHSVGSYLTMGGKLYRVTTAIASGESIIPGTNVTETTVMEEVLNLIQ